MTSNRPSGRPSSGGGVPPTSRRSARQQRLAQREANRNLTRASTRGSSGSNGPLMMYTIIAVAIAAVVIAGAFIVTNQSKAKVPLTAPNAPVGSALTPSSIPVNGFTLGDANAKHTVDIYEDFQCPYCRDFTVGTEPQIVANYVSGGRAKIVWHDLVIIDSRVGGTESLDAANAARCAADQGMFWPYHDWLYTNQYSEGSGAFSKDRLKTIGKLAGIADLNKFNSCVDGGTHNADVTAASAASLAAGYSSTPTIVVDGTALANGNFDYGSISAALDKALGITPSPSVGASTSPSASQSASPTSTATPTATPTASPS
jgi:protein-disulfide isomerase